VSVKDNLQYQIAKEVTWGTGVTATTKLMGVQDGRIIPEVTAELLQAMLGSYQPGLNTVIKAQAGAGYVEQFLTYEDASYGLEGMCGIATPSGAGPYVRAGAAPNASVITPRIFSYYKGEGSNVYRLLGALVLRYTLTIESKQGENSQTVKERMDFIGKTADANGTLAALSDRSVTPVMGDDLVIYLDAWGGTIGTTALIPVAFKVELQLFPNWVLYPNLGSLSAAGYEMQKWVTAQNTLKVSMRLDSTSKGYLDSILAASAVWERQMRLKFTNGTNICQYDFAGFAPESPEVFDDNDGVLMLDFTLQGKYNSTLGNFFKYSNTNGVSALP